MKKESNGQGPYSSGSKTKDYRFFVVAAVFLIICIAFSVVFIITLNKGPSKLYETLDVRTETVMGERGRIFDRNGKLLVGNSTTYSFNFEYGSMGYSSDEISSALLECISALNQTGNSSLRSADYFVLKGTYPNLTFVSDLADRDSAIYHYYNKFLTRNKLSDDMSSADFIKFFTE